MTDKTRKDDKDARLLEGASVSNWICWSQASQLVYNILSNADNSAEDISIALNGLEKLLDSSTAVTGALSREVLNNNLLTEIREVFY